MATIDTSTDTVTMNVAEYENLTKKPVPPPPFNYKFHVDIAKQTFEETIPKDAERSRWTALQERLIAWQSMTFGSQPFERQALGIIEELGELDAAQDEEEADDGVADVTVFSSQLLAIWRLDLGKIVAAARWLAGEVQRRPLKNPIRVSGRLAHVTLKTLQGVRGMDDQETARLAIGTVVIDALALMWLRVGVGGAEDNLYSLVLPVAEKVMLRTKNLPQVPA